MIDERRYILVNFAEVTPSMIGACIQTSIDTLRHVRFAGDVTDWVALKWRGDKPVELWNEYPVITAEEMRSLLILDLNSQINF